MYGVLFNENPTNFDMTTSARSLVPFLRSHTVKGVFIKATFEGNSCAVSDGIKAVVAINSRNI